MSHNGRLDSAGLTVAYLTLITCIHTVSLIAKILCFTSANKQIKEHEEHDQIKGKIQPFVGLHFSLVTNKQPIGLFFCAVDRRISNDEKLECVCQEVAATYFRYT
jgi:hypothetical protein